MLKEGSTSEGSSLQFIGLFVGSECGVLSELQESSAHGRPDVPEAVVGIVPLRKVLITDVKSNGACLGSAMLYKNVFPLASVSGWGWRFPCP